MMEVQHETSDLAWLLTIETEPNDQFSQQNTNLFHHIEEVYGLSRLNKTEAPLSKFVSVLAVLLYTQM